MLLSREIQRDTDYEIQSNLAIKSVHILTPIHFD